MKKYILTILLGSAMCSLSAQHIADSNFVQAIKWQCPTCIDTSNNLTTAAQGVRTITLSNNITDLTGISGFSALTALNCADNNLTSLPTLPANLRTLHCSNNKLTALPTLPSTLATLYCRSNQLLSLPTLPPNLLLLDCSNNKINKIPALPFTLKNFYCSYNEIFTLPYLPGSITDMGCSNNFISKLPDLPPFLIFLSCFSNTALICLPTLPDSLLYIEVSPTITCLPNAIKKLSIFQYDVDGFDIEVDDYKKIFLIHSRFDEGLQFYDLFDRVDAESLISKIMSQLYIHMKEISEQNRDFLPIIVVPSS